MTFTPRECEVAAMVAAGVRVKRIAAALDVSERRVRVIVSAIAFKIGADPDRDERVQVALWWDARHGVAA
jgi:DNA-binding NarL/FixJ family response regulator